MASSLRTSNSRHNSNNNNNNKSKDGVMKELISLFGSILHIDIIKTVAHQCEFDIDKSSHWLLEMSNNVKDDAPQQQTKSFTKKTPPTNSKQVTPKKSCNQPQRLQPSPSTNSIPNKSKKAQDLERVCHNIREGYKVLVILRGMPGSGKSRLATAITDVTLGPGNNQHHILSADDYFMQPRFGYVFDPNKLSEAHEANQRKAFLAMSRGLSPIIIDNTNTKLWEMKPYATMATDYGYMVEILEPDTWWCFNEKELARRNVHGVPRSKIKEMMERYDRNVTPQKLLSAYNLIYKFQRPPQFRLLPPLTKNNPPQNSMADISWNSPKHDERIVKSKSTSALVDRQDSLESKSSDGAEMINLINFNDNTATASYHNTADNTNFLNINPLDEILMCNENNASNILQPNQITDTITAPSARNVTNLFGEVENAWGVDVKALRSWDIVTPLQCENTTTNTFEVDFAAHATEMGIKAESKESATSVDLSDFEIVEKPDRWGDFKIVDARGRDINFGLLPKERGVPKKIMVDKSCLTEDDKVDEMNEEEHIKKLMDFFPKIPKSYLKDLYYKCDRNFNWAIDVLLDDNSHVLINNDNLDDGDDDDDDSVIKTTPIESILSDGNNSSDNNDRDVKKKKNNISEEALQLKRCIESKIDIDKQHYSEHVYKIKQSRFGVASNYNNADKPSTSSAYNELSSDSEDGSLEEFEDDPKNMIELNLGDALVAQLKTLFSVDDTTLPDGFQPVVQMPKDLALQIFTLYAESVCQQMEAQNYILDRLEKEDEEFARQLQMQEEAKLLPPEKPPNLSEIMDEQIALSLHQKKIDEWKNMTADNLAAKLTRQKLFSVFPMVPQDTLVEILHAYGNDYNRTVEDLMTSVSSEFINGTRDAIKEPPLSQNIIDEMKNAEKYCEDETEPEEIKPPQFYREEANKHLAKREELYEKARNYSQRGMTEVAMFYSELAKKETQLYDKANHRAAIAFAEEHSKRLQKFDTLDLHYLYVKEAIPILDIFIDRNINLLRGSSAKRVQDLFIITGRGKNSPGGTSRIQPAVKQRLKERKIHYVHLNPGLLKIKITQDFVVTTDLR